MMRSFMIGQKAPLPVVELFTLELPPLPAPSQPVTRGRAKPKADPEPRTIIFHGQGNIPSMILIDVERSGKTIGEAAAVVHTLFKAAIVPEEWDLFQETLADPLNKIDMDDIAAIYNHVHDYYTAVPTTRA